MVPSFGGEPFDGIRTQGIRLLSRGLQFKRYNMVADPNTVKVQGLVKFFDELPEQETKKLQNNPQAVLAKIDEYSQTNNLMIVGKKKGKIVYDEILKKNPVTMIELGCFIGYSAIYFSQGLSNDTNAKYYSFEANQYFADVAQRFINLAGLQDKIEIIVGKANSSLESFQDQLFAKFHEYLPLDFIFIDHWKDLYVPDLRLLETLSMIGPGTVIVADNILKPGAPEYAQYVQSSPEERRQHNYDVENINGARFMGRWNILYESKTVEVELEDGSKDAVEITVCTDFLNG